MWGWFNLLGWGVGGGVLKKNPRLWLVHGLTIPLNHVKASSKTSLVLNRKKLPNYSFYSLSSLSLLYITIPLKLQTTPWLWESPLRSQHLSRHHSITIPSFLSSYTSLHTASLSFLLSNENNRWLIVLGWLIEALHTAGGLRPYRRSHLCWVGLQLTEISSTDTSPALLWGMCCVISRLKQTTLLGSFEVPWVKY